MSMLGLAGTEEEATMRSGPGRKVGGFGVRSGCPPLLIAEHCCDFPAGAGSAG